MRRAIAVSALLLIASLLPVGAGPALAADPDRSQLPPVDSGALRTTSLTPATGRANSVADAVTLQVAVPSDPMPAGPVTATATLSADPGGGVIDWGWVPDVLDHEVPVGPGGVTELDLGSLATNNYHVYVWFPGYGALDAATDDVAFSVWNPSSTWLVTNRTSATVGELPVVLTATVTGVSSTPAAVTFLDDVGGVVLSLGPVQLDPNTFTASYSSSSLRTGVHTITARFEGGPWVLPSTSEPVTVTVGVDTAVHATFGASRSTFYPWKDGYRDTVALGGRLYERATVTIRAYAKSGSLKRTWTLGSRAPGTYSVKWNGKSSSGATLPAGRYTLKATFKDTLGHTRTITIHTSISWRRVAWRSGTVVTHYGNQLHFYANGPALFYSPDYARGRTMDTGEMDRNCDPGCLEIYGKRAFQLKTGALDYRHVFIEINGHGYEDRDHTGTAYVVHPGSGAWDYSAPLPAYVGHGITAGIPISRSQVSTTDRVTVVLDCSANSGDAFDIHWLRLSYQYAVWR